MLTVQRAATLSEDGLYRYDLTRRWGEGGRATFVLLNPSTADHHVDDPTVTAVVHFARSAHERRIGAVTIVNLFALRATDPSALRFHPDPVGTDNDAALARHAREADAIVVGWGEQGATFPERVRAVVDLLRPYELWCLGTTAKGHPRHPQRLARSTPWTAFDPTPLLKATPHRRPPAMAAGPTEAAVVAAFCRWLTEQGWAVETEVGWADVVATRSGHRLVAEAKGATTSPNLDIDTAYGQLLRRMDDDDDATRYALVVPERHVAGALRVPAPVRRSLRIDVYGVDDSGTVTVHHP